MNPPVTFTRAGLVTGVRRTLPIALGDFAFGIVFGVVARQAGLSLSEAVLMSGLVFAGAAQFIAIGLWTAPLPIVSLIATTLVVNLRHLLMGAALRPWFARLSPGKAYGALFFLTDETWALAMRDYAAGARDAAFVLGSGLTLWAAWTSWAGVGYLVGAGLGDPARWGLDFMFTTVFTALLVGLWKGKADLLPWAVAAGLAVAAAQWLPGKWYILLGGLAGSLVGRGAMAADPLALLTILGMAAVTYATRVAGLWLMGRVTPSPGVEAWLRHIPGAVLIAIVAPTLPAGGPAEALATAATVGVTARTGNFFLAIAVGVGAVWVLRQVL